MKDSTARDVLFISHAALDADLAKTIKAALEECFPGIDVFVSSDPEDLAPGDPWVEKILDHLHRAKLIVVVATSRGLSRRWVWFEVGAGWRSKLRLIPCCVGELRKDNLPAPFSIYQALNIDTPSDLQSLFNQLENEFGSKVVTPNFQSIAEELTRIDVRLEERARVTREGQFGKEMREGVAKGLAALSPAQREAVRLLFIHGDLTDRQAIKFAKEAGLSYNSAGIYHPIADSTSFVQRVWPLHDQERVYGYQGPWTLNPKLKPLLEDVLLQSDSDTH